MSPNLSEKKGLFEAWVQYTDEQRRAVEAGEDPEAVLFRFKDNISHLTSHMDEDEENEGESDDEVQGGD